MAWIEHDYADSDALIAAVTAELRGRCESGLTQRGHALLSLALVANGIGGAMASVHAVCAHAAVAAAAPASESSSVEPSCHEDMGAGTSN